MASIVSFDVADPSIKEMIAGWADNTDYTVVLTVRTGAGNQRNIARIVGPVEEQEMEETEEQEEAGEMEQGNVGVEAGSPGPSAIKRALSTGGVMKRSMQTGGASATGG